MEEVRIHIVGESNVGKKSLAKALGGVLVESTETICVYDLTFSSSKASLSEDAAASSSVEMWVYQNGASPFDSDEDADTQLQQGDIVMLVFDLTKRASVPYVLDYVSCFSFSCFFLFFQLRK